MHIHIFKSIYTAEELIIPYGLKPFDICTKNPVLWKYIKITHIISFAFSILVLSNFFISKISKMIFKSNSHGKNLSKINSNTITNTHIPSSKQMNLFHKMKKSKTTSIAKNAEALQLLIGFDEESKNNIYIPESGLYQNFLITGTIGSGKTSSAMYPFTKQILQFNHYHPDKKIAMLILDVKGNYYAQVKKFCKSFDLLSDLIVIELNAGIYYNPLHSPLFKANFLAIRLKTIFLLF